MNLILMRNIDLLTKSERLMKASTQRVSEALGNHTSYKGYKATNTRTRVQVSIVCTEAASNVLRDNLSVPVGHNKVGG